MPGTPLIVIGASAGGIEALRQLTPTLPADLPASVAIVVHRQPIEEDERLPRVLSKDSPLPVTHARDGEPVRAAQIVVAPANVHLRVNDGTFQLDPGPK
ncbi:MAG: chemotaxis protein CheB, partial [Candidatus Eremiobacteraeota bacterium]|nr:chemotaxis protein CheB [Candidatus Eremiobacteraeota bacterium]